MTGAVASRLDFLPTETRGILDAASVLGNRLLPDVLGAVTGDPPAVILDRLAPAIDAGLVRRSPGDELWFSHDLFRETIHAQLSVSAERELHGRIGHALEARADRGRDGATGRSGRALRTGDSPGRSDPRDPVGEGRCLR